MNTYLKGGPLLEAGRTYKFASLGYLNTPFRYNHKPRDQGFEVNLNLINGSSEVFLTVRDEPNYDDNNILAATFGHNNVFVCPSSNSSFVDTYTFFIFIFSTDLGVNYEFELTINVVKNTFSPPPFSPLNYTVLEPKFCYSSDYDIEDSSFFFSESFSFEECTAMRLVFPLKSPSCRFLSFFSFLFFSFLFFFLFKHSLSLFIFHQKEQFQLLLRMLERIFSLG